MSIEAEVTQAVYDSSSGDGLYQVVMGAAGAVMGQDLDSPGVLEIQPDGQTRSSPSWLRIEAAFAEGVSERLIGKLDLRVRRLSSDVPLKLLDQSLVALGGLAFTNLCVGPTLSGSHPGAEDVLDVTVSFPWLPFLASNTALVIDSPGADDISLSQSVCAALGVRHRQAARGITVARWQIRSPMRHEAQVAAFTAATAGRRRVSIYSAVLPPRQSVRLERGWAKVDGTDQSYVDVCLSQGLTSGDATSQAEARTMQELVERHLGIEFGEKRYRVAASKWSAGRTEARPGS